jgi:hypothetical protein
MAVGALLVIAQAIVLIQVVSKGVNSRPSLFLAAVGGLSIAVQVLYMVSLLRRDRERWWRAYPVTLIGAFFFMLSLVPRLLVVP